MCVDGYIEDPNNQGGECLRELSKLARLQTCTIV